MNQPSRSRIDTHLHVVPPVYADWLRGMGIDAGGRAIPDWHIDRALDLMDQLGTASAVLSVSTPGVYIGDGGNARAMARAVNEFSAEQVRLRPDRFGFFATLVLPDLEGSLAELEHAYDVLGADGVVLLANEGGVYVGDSSMEPLFAELDRRAAVVFIHPSQLPGPAVPGIPPFAADFLLDTTRAAINIARAGWLERFPNVRIILSHGGGFVPYAAERIARVCSAYDDYQHGIERLRRFYFDTALSSSHYALPALLAFAPHDHIFFGSDWPYAPAERGAHFSGLLDCFPMSAEQARAINRDNALRLFPRFAGHGAG